VLAPTCKTAPWPCTTSTPPGVDQREGRIIRQGNLNEEVQVIRYLAARSFDGYMWQTLERKARFIHDVMSPSLDTREIGDIGDTVLSFSEAKALATNNPLLMDKAEADAELSRLVRAERAHARNQDALRRAVTRLEKHIATQTRIAGDIDTAIARRQDTRGEAFTMTVEDRAYRKRIDAGLHLLQVLRQEAANQLGSRQRILRTGELGGFPLTVTISRALGQVNVTPALEGAPGTEITLAARDLTDADPAGLVTRLEYRLAHLEANKAKALTEIDHARSEIDHATASIGKAFPQATELAAARDRSRQIDEQLEAAADPPQPQEAEAPVDSSVPVHHESPVTSERVGSPATSRATDIVADRPSPSRDDIRGTAPGQWAGQATPSRTADHRRQHDPSASPSQSPHEPDRPKLRVGNEPNIRPPWPSASERQPGSTPNRRFGPDLSAGHYWRPSFALPQYSDIEQRRRPTLGNDRHTHEPEAGQ
jgi:hypothetical protein